MAYGHTHALRLAISLTLNTPERRIMVLIYAILQRCQYNIWQIGRIRLRHSRRLSFFSKVNTITRQEAGGRSLPNTLPNHYSEIIPFP